MARTPTPSEMSGIQWPPSAVPTRAGPQWLRCSGFNQALEDCRRAYDQHVDTYAQHPSDWCLIANWPRDTSRALNPQKDYVEGYGNAMWHIERAFGQSRAVANVPAIEKSPADSASPHSRMKP